MINLLRSTDDDFPYNPSLFPPVALVNAGGVDTHIGQNLSLHYMSRIGNMRLLEGTDIFGFTTMVTTIDWTKLSRLYGYGVNVRVRYFN